MEEEKNKLIRQSAIFMMLSEHTSKGDVEGFGIAILEANALGLPAIGSENCGIEDAIKDGYSGKLVNQHQPQEIEQAIEEIVNNYGSYSSQAKLHAKQFDWSKIGAKYIEVLQRY
jgi:phosphatidylinositol alpha-1,6-mannosyltransferase